MLADTVSRTPHMSVNDVDVLKVDLEGVIDGYEDDNFFGPWTRVMNGEELKDKIKEKKLQKLAPLFHRDGTSCCTTEKLVCLVKLSEMWWI